MSCDTCASIAITGKDALAEKQHSTVIVDWAPLQNSAGDGCLSCRIIQGAVLARVTEKLTVHCIRIYAAEGDALCIAVDCREEGSPWAIRNYFYPFTAQQTPWTLIPVDTFANPEPPTIETSVPQIQAWIKRCDASHGCINYALGVQSGLPTRLIDVGDSSHEPRLHVTTGEDGPYIALSHCWGPSYTSKRLTTTKSNLADHCNRLPLEELPRTFRDAIMVTRELGLQYIWIDSLCIIQDSLADWSFESSRMSEVYSNAHLTLAGDLGPDSDAGLFMSDSQTANNTPQVRQFTQVDETGVSHQIFVRKIWPVPGQKRQKALSNTRYCYASEASSNLDSRAWVFQESILSSRTVYFTNAELVWQCQNAYECPCGFPILKRSNRSSFAAMVKSSATRETPCEEISNLWHSLVEEYSARQLTYATDRLSAMSGLAKLTPFPEADYLAGLWRKTLLSDLVWVNPLGRTFKESDRGSLPVGSCRIEGEYAPTWSWASITDPVIFEIEDLRDIVPEWTIIEPFCEPTTRNPYGPVSSKSSLLAEGYMIPVVFHPSINDAPSYDDGTNSGPSMEVWVVRRMDEAFRGRNKTWMDAGAGADEWSRGDEGYAYAYHVLVIGHQGENQIPMGLILREAPDRTNDSYTRIGMVLLENWAGHDWKVGAEKRVVRIF